MTISTFNHRLTLAFCLNAVATDTTGQRVAALIAPVLLLTLWCPAWLYRQLARLPALAVRLADMGRHEWREWYWTVQTCGTIVRGWTGGTLCGA